MGDEFDGCECVWSHELAMRRLLNLIRQGQSHCTDTDCINPLSLTASRSEQQNEGENFAMVTMFFILAVILYFLRPSTVLRSFNSESKKPQEPPAHGGGGQGPDHGAPPAIN